MEAGFAEQAEGQNEDVVGGLALDEGQSLSGSTLARPEGDGELRSRSRLLASQLVEEHKAAPGQTSRRITHDKSCPGFLPNLGPPGLPGGPGSPGNGPGSTNRAGCSKNQLRRPIIRPIRAHFVFLGPTAKR